VQVSGFSPRTASQLSPDAKEELLFLQKITTFIHSVSCNRKFLSCLQLTPSGEQVCSFRTWNRLVCHSRGICTKYECAPTFQTIFCKPGM